MVRVFQTFASERQLRKLSGSFEIKSAADYTPRPGDPDYVPRSDVPWLKRFAADGGKVIISGNTEMKYVPHERLALIESGFVVFFFENQWSRWKFFRKCALLLHWWPIIAAKIKRAKAGSFWHIPSSWPEKGKLRAISNEDPRQLRIERKHAARRGKKSKAVAVRPPSTSSSIGPLFEYVEAKNEIENARKKSNSTADKTDATP